MQDPSISVNAITRDDILRAERELEEGINHWGNAGRLRVLPDELAKAELRTKNLSEEWQKIEQAQLPIDELEQFEEESRMNRRNCRLHSRLLALNHLQKGFWVYSAFLQRIFILPHEKMWVISLLHGAWGLLLAGLLSISFSTGTLIFGILGTIAYTIAVLLSLRLLLTARKASTESVLNELRNRQSLLRLEVDEAKAKLTQLQSYCTKLRRGRSIRDELEISQKRLNHLQENSIAQAAYDKALEELKRLKELIGSERYKLMGMDWRSLRGIPFEDFLAQIFRSLGYRVQKTKVTGDQGVDLIVSRSGLQIAVQAKGYEGNVGNDAVQQVQTGMLHYRCDECVVITNSRFTRAAEVLAESVQCRLINGDQIVALINGQIL